MTAKRGEIGYYVHHHGLGHASRARAICAHAHGGVTVLSSLGPEAFEPLHGAERPRYVGLPLDMGDTNGLAATPPELHFAPLGSRGLAARMARIASWIEAASPSLLVVDVSVEVAALARLCGVSVVYVRQYGKRTDAAHELAYGWADHLLAPFEAELDPGGVSRGVRERTRHSGTVTRFDHLERPDPEVGRRDRRVLVMGEPLTALASQIALSSPDWRVTVAAGRLPADAPANLERVDPGAITLALLGSCRVVIGAGGANLVGECAFARAGLVCIPQPRPFEEQLVRGELLERRRAAVVLDSAPPPSRWPELLERAAMRAPELASWADGTGAERAAAFLDRWAAEPNATQGAGVVTSSRSRSGSHSTRPREASSSNQPAAGQVPQVR